ncbi:uncharacterized protein [Spinacia oleracea]|uniref:Reverse transcriptase zinc-binding domain-containing protein n=1 Tax=Spinacia oleracea TaxID=3562 RepID=A0A9R0JEQ0_SPIOL|nr:uncharacterized protein LOC110805396 [Spinacia oleracea]
MGNGEDISQAILPAGNGRRFLVENRPKVHWDRLVWNRLNTLKHIFISWLAIQARLQTAAKLAKLGISNSARCLISGQGDEDHDNLFFWCPYSNRCLLEMKNWMGLQCTGNNLHHLSRCISQSRSTKFRKQVYFTELVALVYLIWKCRNTSYWDQTIPTVKNTIKNIKHFVKSRIQAVLPKNVSSSCVAKLNLFGGLDCPLCKISYFEQDLRQEHFVQNVVNIYSNMKASTHMLNPCSFLANLIIFSNSEMFCSLLLVKFDGLTASPQRVADFFLRLTAGKLPSKKSSKRTKIKDKSHDQSGKKQKQFLRQCSEMANTVNGSGTNKQLNLILQV